MNGNGAHSNIDSLIANANIGSILQKVKYKTLGTLGKAAIDIAPETIGEFVGYDPRTLRLMAHYIQGSGKPYDFEMSNAEWEELIKSANRRYSRFKRTDGHSGRQWTKSTNPEKVGWEYMSGIRPRGEGGRLLWDILGSTTIRRKKLKSGDYGYELAGEKFDFVSGEDKSGGDMAYAGGKYFDESRVVSQQAASILSTLFPEIISDELGRAKEDMVWPVNIPEGSESIYLEGLHSVGKQFPLVSRYIDRK